MQAELVLSQKVSTGSTTISLSLPGLKDGMLAIGWLDKDAGKFFSWVCLRYIFLLEVHGL